MRERAAACFRIFHSCGASGETVEKKKKRRKQGSRRSRLALREVPYSNTWDTGYGPRRAGTTRSTRRLVP
jgi:hypothetical protein